MKYISLLVLSMAFAAIEGNCQPVQHMDKSIWPAEKPPVAEKKPHRMEAHGDVRVDPYYWMNDYFKKGPDSTSVVKYLEAENDYYTKMMAGTEALQEKLYKEMRQRIKEQDESVPYFKNGYHYYTRQVAGKDYYLFCRKKGSLDAQEEILLDVNAMAEGHAYYAATGFKVSPDNNLLAYAVDTKSRRQYVIYVRDLTTGKDLPISITGADGNPVWAADSKTLFYVAKNPETLLSEKIMRHRLGTPVSNDLIVYEEKDPSNYIFISGTKSDKYILLHSFSTMDSEAMFLPSDQPESAFKTFQPRMKDVLYSVDHAGSTFYIRTNYEAKNFKLVSAPENSTRTISWTDVVPHRSDVLVQDFEVFRDHLVISERKGGLNQLHVIDLKENTEHFISFNDPAYYTGLAFNPGYETDVVRFNYTSFTIPSSVYDYNMNTRRKTLLKQQPVLGDFDPDNYVSERIEATATDGTIIPVSMVYRKGFKKDGTMPVLLYGYGSYGASMEVTFSSTRLSLLDRGFAYAIAHIRGGEEMGRSWYEDGKMMKKMNTFTDFINVAEHLVNNKYTSPKHLYAMGGSAGGLLMGAVINIRPDLFNGVIAAVPFVDVLTTMSDPTIPLTTNEYDEWGNPADRESYFYIKSYSPYDNIKPQAYPNLLITTGLHDSQVQYFEPAKWVPRLRENNTGNSVILLHTDMSVGHGGASGRFKALYDRAREMAFLLALEGIRD